MDEFTEICSVEEIPANEPLTLEVDGLPIAIGRVGDQYFAVEDRCPHENSSFEGGDIEDDVLTCPLHGWRTNIKSGQSLNVPSLRLKTYPVRVINGKIHLKLK